MGIIVRQSIKGTIVNYMGSFLGFIMTFFIMIRFLTPEEVGLTRVLVDAGLLFAGLSQLGTNASIIRFYPYFKDPEKKDHGFFFWSLLVPFIGFLIVMTLFLIFKGPISGFFAEKSPLFVNYYNYVIPLGFFLLYISVFETNSNVLLRIVIPKFIREVVIRLMMIVVYSLYAFRLFDLDVFVILFCSVYGMALLLNIFYQFRLQKVSLKPDLHFITKPLRRNFLFYTLFLVTAAVGSAITPMLNSFFVSAKMGLGYTGIFAVATYIAAIIEIPYRSLGAITQPHLSQAVKENNIAKADSLCKSVSLHQFMVGSLIFFFIWINIDVIFQIIPNGSFYVAGKWAVFIIGLSRLLTSSLSVGTTVLSYSKYYYFSLFFSFMLTGLAIFFNLKWIPLWGIYGAASATLVSYLIYYLLLLSLVKWKMKTSPFSMNQLKVAGLILFLFLLNGLWEISLGPLFAKIPIESVYSTIANRLLCSLLMAGIAAFLLYKSHISVQVNTLMDKGWEFAKKILSGKPKRKEEN